MQIEKKEENKIGVFFLLLTICLFSIAFINTSAKLEDDTFKSHELELKERQKKILIWGILAILLISTVVISSIIHQNAETSMYDYNTIDDKANARKVWDITLLLTIIVPIIYVIVMVIFLVQWAMVTSKNDIIREKKEQRIKAELSKYTIDREIRNGNNIVSLDNKHEILIIRNTSDMTYDIIKYGELLSCEILENNSTVMKGGVGRAVVGGIIAGGAGAIVGANTRKSEIMRELTIRIITSNSRKSSYVIKLQGENLSNEAYNFINEVYAIITNLINQYSKREKAQVSANNDITEQIEKLAILKEKKLLQKKNLKQKRKNY